VRDRLDAQALHHALEHARFRDRAVVEIKSCRNALQWIGAVGLGRHRGEEEAQRRLHVLAMDAMILEVGEARAVIDDREQHERRRRAALCVDPARRRQLLQIAWTEVEVPEVVGPQSWLGLFGQVFRLDRWSVCRVQAAAICGRRVK
jgi:hypothetical protein